MRRLFWLLALVGGSAHAEAPALEGAELLQRMATAARELSYVGTYNYSRGDFSETTKVFHHGDPSGGVGHFETLSGKPKEIIRVGLDVTWYMPENRIIRTERQSFRKFFPELVAPERVRTLSQFYDVSRGSNDRVAGLDCVNVTLTPKDNFRYAQSICLEPRTLLPLRAATLNERQERLETFAFTQVEVPARVEATDLRAKSRDTSGWTQESINQNIDPASSNWYFRELPAGFAVVSETQRSMPGRSAPVVHKLLSDGLVWVSVFVEPLSNIPVMGRGLSQQGGAGTYSRPVGNQHVTVVGLVPVSTLVLIGGALTQRNAQP
jgi:sigma-E factor negative regulatory protein RseB